MKSILPSNSPSILAGRLRHRLQILGLNTTTDTEGGSSLSNIVVLREVWGAVEALSGTEKFAAHEFVSQVTHAIYIRVQPDLIVTADMQIGFTTPITGQFRRFQIEAVLNPDERARILQLMCVEINDSLQQNPTPGVDG